NVSCATTSGCRCEDDELQCLNEDTGVTECFAREWYSDCPGACSSGLELCPVISFRSGMPHREETCVEPVAGSCPVLCDNTSAQKCPGAGNQEFCIDFLDSCPKTCAEGEQLCSVENMDIHGRVLVTSMLCVPAADPCPCGQNAWSCGEFCAPASDGCPGTCEAGKVCLPVSYTVEGMYQPNASVVAGCIDASQSCQCGQNAQMCMWTDSKGQERAECRASAVECPMTCSGKLCNLADYRLNGMVKGSRELCLVHDGECPCGENAIQCRAGQETYCLPRWDAESQRLSECPLECGDDEQRCCVPSFGATGEFLRTEEICVPKGQPCSCGAGGFECNYT
ncbi:UVR8, partial [Symbiodinium sp. CCMP2456]